MLRNEAPDGRGEDADHRLEIAAEYASDVGVLGVLRALTRLRGLILLPVIAGGLGSAAYGVWTQSLVAVSLGSSLIDLQLHTAVVRFVSGNRNRDEQRAIFMPSLFLVACLGLLVALVIWVIPDPVSALVFGDQAYSDIGRWLGIWIAIAASSRLGMHLLRGLHKVKLYGLFSTGQILVQLSAVAGVILWSQDLLLAVLAAVLVELTTAILVLAVCFRSLGIEWPRIGRLGRNLSFSLPLVPSYYAESVFSAADRLVIAAQFGAEAIGVYAAAYSLARLVREMIVPVNTALMPAVSRSWDRGERDQSLWLLANTVRYYLLLAVPALAGIVLLGPRVLAYLASEQIAAGVGPLLPLVGLGLLLASVQTIFAILLQLMGDTRSLGLSRTASASLYVVLVLIAVPRWGLLGGALATAVGYTIDLIFTVFLARRGQPIQIPWPSLGKSAIGALLMIPIVLITDVGGLGGLGLAIVAGGTSYVIALFALRALGRKELDFLVSLVLKRKEPHQAH